MEDGHESNLLLSALCEIFFPHFSFYYDDDEISLFLWEVFFSFFYGNIVFDVSL